MVSHNIPATWQLGSLAAYIMINMAVRQLGISAARGQQLVRLQLGSSAESYSSNIGSSTAWQPFICMLTGAEAVNRAFVLFAGSKCIGTINAVSKSIRAYLPPGMDKIRF
jgi:hypothetical protein